MHPDDQDDDPGQDPFTWLVLCNSARQHALWPTCRPVPEGWLEVGPEGSRAECLAWIDQHWTDMRPQSLQQA